MIRQTGSRSSNAAVSVWRVRTPGWPALIFSGLTSQRSDPLPLPTERPLVSWSRTSLLSSSWVRRKSKLSPAKSGSSDGSRNFSRSTLAKNSSRLFTVDIRARAMGLPASASRRICSSLGNPTSRSRPSHSGQSTWSSCRNSSWEAALPGPDHPHRAHVNVACRQGSRSVTRPLSGSCQSVADDPSASRSEPAGGVGAIRKSASPLVGRAIQPSRRAWARKLSGTGATWCSCAARADSEAITASSASSDFGT